MEFECDFDKTNFCHYSSFGWGFHKSMKIANEIFMEVGKNSLGIINNVKQQNKFQTNIPTTNYFPCTADGINGISKLVKGIPKNLSQSLCLKMAYLFEENGRISITDHKSKWSANITQNNNKWNYITFPVNIQTPDSSSAIDSTLEISGQFICVDNLTVSHHPCLLPTSYDNKFSSGRTLWITQPFSVLLAIITLMVVLMLIGITLSFVCARKSQRTLQKSKQSSRRNKHIRMDRSSIQNSIIHEATINSNFDIDTFGSNRRFSNQNRCLPAVVHVRSNPQLFCYSRHHSFLVSKSMENNETNPNFRFSLALTEDAQVQLLTSSNMNSSSPPVSSDLSARNLPIVRQQSFTTTISHERTPSPTESLPVQIPLPLPLPRLDNPSQQRPHSIVIVPSFCAPILDQSESDLSIDSVHTTQQFSQNISRYDRSRPIRESMNIGYVSDNSPCDLPQYDAALELLAAHKIKMAQSINENDQSDVANNNNTDDQFLQFDTID